MFNFNLQILSYILLKNFLLYYIIILSLDSNPVKTPIEFSFNHVRVRLYIRKMQSLSVLIFAGK